MSSLRSLKKELQFRILQAESRSQLSFVSRIIPLPNFFKHYQSEFAGSLKHYEGIYRYEVLAIHYLYTPIS